MNRGTWREVVAGLRAQAPRRPAGVAEGFWTDFAARSRLRSRQDPAGDRVRSAVWGWAAAATCATILALWLGPRGSRPPGGGLSQVESLEITAPHRAVMIMNDEGTQSTVLWIVDMEDAQEGGGPA